MPTKKEYCLPNYLTAPQKTEVRAALQAYTAGDKLAIHRMVRETFGYRGADAMRATRRWKRLA